MSVQFDATRSKYVVRWREDGRQRTRRFAHQPEAMAFDATVNPNGRTSRRDADSEGRRTAVTRVAELESERDRDKRDGVYPYATKQGVRWRIVFRQSDGTLSFRRGFTSRTAAATARRRLQDSDERGEVKDSREDIAAFWTRFVADRRAYMTAGSHLDLITHGHRRLVPFLGAERVSKIDEDRVREWMALMVDHVEAGELSPKTVNNARTHLSVAFNEAVRRGLMTRNPCTFVPALLVQRTEIEYLRLAEIGPYLRACADHYAVLAAFLIGTGARVSEAIAIQWRDLDLDQGVVLISRQGRSRGGDRLLGPANALGVRAPQKLRHLTHATGRRDEGRRCRRVSAPRRALSERVAAPNRMPSRPCVTRERTSPEARDRSYHAAARSAMPWL